MTRIEAVLFVLAVALVAGARHFVKQRNKVKGIPTSPASFLWGNLKIAGECTRKFPKGSHPHLWAAYLHKKYNLGNVFMLDLWPIGPRALYIADPEIASEYVTTGQSIPKSLLLHDWLSTLLGPNIIIAEGQEWKRLRTMFNPGFSASHLMTLVPWIIDASEIFYEIMLGKANSNALIELEEYAARITIDVIGKVVLDADFDSQKASHPIVKTFRTRIGLLRNVTSPLPWHGFDAFRPIKLWLNQRKLDRLISEELDRKYAIRANNVKATSFKDRKKSVVDLALDGYEKETATLKDGRPANVLENPQIRSDIINSMKTFIFAGYNTTASTIAYTMYLLHFHPTVHERLIAEIESVFGANASHKKISTAIKRDPYVINRLDYLTAVLKETLRLFPPASTLRHMPAASDPATENYVVDPASGSKYLMSGFTVWPVAHLIGRNEKFFPQCEQFIPERFIPSQTPFPDAALFTPAGKDAWRPFEKGPRNCIGQELAMIEGKVILAMIVKDFDFVAEFDGVRCETLTAKSIVEDPVKSSDRTVEGYRCYQMLKGAAKPVDGMPGRLSFRKRS